MPPLDPVRSASQNQPPSTPPYLDEDPTLESVEEGLDLAEDDTRNLAFGDDEEPAPSVEDVFDEDEEIAPEVSAIHEIDLPRAED